MIQKTTLLETINSIKEIIIEKEDELVLTANKFPYTDYKQDLDYIDTQYRLLKRLKTMMQERFGVVL